jgi:hypothetical protein
MLRRTNRLPLFLAAHDRILWFPHGPWVEVEFQGTPESAGTDRDTENTVFPLPEIDITTLCELVDGVTHEGPWIYFGARMPCHPLILQDTSIDIPDNATLDVLWLSAIEFVSWHDFGGLLVNDLLVEKTHEIWVSERGVRGGCFEVSFNVFKLNPANAEERQSASNPSELSLRFLSRALEPALHLVEAIRLTFLVAPPAEAVLSLVPTTAQSINADFRICLEGQWLEVLPALASHPVHPRVDLRFDKIDNKDEEMNDYFRQFQHPLHLNIPDQLLEYECIGEPFTANPAFHSMSVSTSRLDSDAQLSPKMLDGIARNQGLDHLTVHCGDLGMSGRLERIADIFRRVVLRRDSHFRMITLASGFMHSDDRPLPNEQGALEQLTELLDPSLNNNHCLSSLRWTFPHNAWDNDIRGHPATRSNSRCDARFSPALVLNWLKRHRVYPSQPVSGLAIQRINQGGLYSYATNLVPWDLSTSSASAIYDTLRYLVSLE